MQSKEDLKVLIVDDDSATLRVVKYSLMKIGYKDVREAASGNVALSILNEDSKYDLIISDLNMPDMDGLQLLKEIRNHKDYENIPFIMLTADGGLNKILEAVKEKVSSYIIKPFTSDILDAKINELFLKK